MARKLQPHEDDPYAIVNTLNDVVDGRSNNVGQVTLAAGATTTQVNYQPCSVSSMIGLSPLTANAAAALSTTYVAAASTLNGSFIITHLNNAQVDRTFRFATIGG
jgi:hypothetical protein